MMRMRPQVVGLIVARGTLLLESSAVARGFGLRRQVGRDGAFGRHEVPVNELPSRRKGVSRPTCHRSPRRPIHLVSCAPADGVARVLHANDGREVAVLRAHADSLVAVAFTPDAMWVVTGGFDHVAPGR